MQGRIAGMVGEIEARHDGRLSLGSLRLFVNRIRWGEVVLEDEMHLKVEIVGRGLNFVVESEVDELSWDVTWMRAYERRAALSMSRWSFVLACTITW